ncbi:hypothetical protein [Oryza sativa Japonica Group]|uniref:Uncharacterized protein n=2 Tax=Oryza sativa subsp. japonica TaxID=39947 RepID=Q5JJQ5_ORYSJ|nr:hypothetical protein [Oryza sativa Japonica Group]BAD88324.1 hypothetical protein [Oryza sativa Japonica Group]
MNGVRRRLAVVRESGSGRRREALGVRRSWFRHWLAASRHAIVNAIPAPTAVPQDHTRCRLQPLLSSCFCLPPFRLAFDEAALVRVFDSVTVVGSRCRLEGGE